MKRAVAAAVWLCLAVPASGRAAENPSSPASPPAPAPAEAGPPDEVELATPSTPPPGAKPPPGKGPVAGHVGGADVPPDSSPLPHYDQGFVLVPTTDPALFPFRLKMNHVSQFKYSNTTHVNPTYTTHLGVVKDVLRRNDFQLTRDVFYFSGYAFDRRLDFNILVYTSTATLSATAAGFAGFVFSRQFALRAGFFSLPSVRSLTGNYPFFQGTDRPMATNYMRPGFTQGIWANGELFPGFNYIAMIGNSLNTLDIAANRIDTNLAYSASIC